MHCFCVYKSKGVKTFGFESIASFLGLIWYESDILGLVCIQMLIVFNSHDYIMAGRYPCIIDKFNKLIKSMLK